MPIIQSAKKKARQAITNRDRNYSTRTALRKAIRSFDDAVKAGNTAEAQKLLASAYKHIDTATKKKVIEKNTASRRKSLLAKKVATLTKRKS